MEHQRVKNESYRSALMQWFTEHRWAKVFPILSNADPDSISLRVLESLGDPAFVEALRIEGVPMCYYISNAADESQKRLFNLPVQLQAAQKVRRKKFMEPFARYNAALENGGRFSFGHESVGTVEETNVAQLQYMRFLIENNVLDWLRRYKKQVFAVKARMDRRR